VQREDPVGSGVLGAFWVFVSLALVAAAMTMVFLAMRAVMEIGGFCAEGGPYVIETHCPKGVPLLMIGGIWGGIIFAFIYAWQAIKRRVPSFVWALWPALFLSLGWNFLEYGLNPPFGQGMAVGWLVCAVVFFLMGGGPLLVALPAVWRALTGRASTPGVREALRPPGSAAVAARVRAAREARTAAATSVSDQPDDVVSALERLHYLHRTGALDDAEYEAAKDRIIGGTS
jgi:hypothetical protein